MNFCFNIKMVSDSGGLLFLGAILTTSLRFSLRIVDQAVKATKALSD